MVLNIDAENQRLSLGGNARHRYLGRPFTRHHVGDNRGQGRPDDNFGAFVELDEGIQGLIHGPSSTSRAGPARVEKTRRSS
jgi:ribosomal protein S1